MFALECTPEGCVCFLFQLRFTVQSVLEAIDRMVTASYIGMVLLLSPAVSEID